MRKRPASMPSEAPQPKTSEAPLVRCGTELQLRCP
jgi:hypothetical protein